jgi:hypothetical protein
MIVKIICVLGNRGELIPKELLAIFLKLRGNL